MNSSPIALFVYKKLEQLQLAVSALQNNKLAKKSDLYIFSDAPKTNLDKEAVDTVRNYIKSIKGFKSIKIQEAENNMGLAKSIINGVTLLLNDYDYVIVLEDDLICSDNFLEYMNQALHFYEKNPKVFSIAGYTPPIDVPKDYGYDTYFTLRASSWGWATWKDRWMDVDWMVSDYQTFKNNRRAKRQFNKMGSDMSGMLHKQMQGKLDSWAIRWCYHQFRQNLYTAFPTLSKIQNVGFVKGATHTKTNSAEERFNTPLDYTEKKSFSFAPEIALIPAIIKQFVIPYSLRTRIHYKLKDLFRL